MTTEVELTNEMIALWLGWKKEPSPKPGALLWRNPEDDWTFTEPPDYLNDPGALGEAERICRGRGWLTDIEVREQTAVLIRKRLATGLSTRITDVVNADTLTAAWWTAIYRADEAERATR